MTLYDPSSIIALFIIFPIIGLVVLALRFYVRLRVQKPPGLWIDDWLILVGAFLTVSLNINGIIGTTVGGLGRHTQISPEGKPIATPRLRTLLHVVYPQDVIEKVAYGLVKLSILFFYRRIFRVQSFRRVNSVIISIVALWAFTYFFVTLFECGVNPGVQWGGTKQAQKAACLDTSRLLLSFAITDVITDFLVLVLPIREVWRLQMATKKKYAVTAIFALGALSTAAGIVRLGLVVISSSVDFGSSSDTLGKLTPPFVWTNLEVSIGVIAASLPTLGPLWKNVRSAMTNRGWSTRQNSADSVAAAKLRMQAYPLGKESQRSSAKVKVKVSMQSLGSGLERGETHGLERLNSIDSAV